MLEARLRARGDIGRRNCDEGKARNLRRVHPREATQSGILQPNDHYRGRSRRTEDKVCAPV